MGLSEWRARRAMRDPVRGVFTRTGDYAPGPGAVTLTGFVSGPGVVSVTVECPADTHGRWTSGTVHPALIDRADPTRFLVLWDEPPPVQQAPNAAATPAPDWGRQLADQAFGATPPPGHQREVRIHVDGADPGAPVPDWARQLAEQALSGGLTSGTQRRVEIQVSGADPGAPTPEWARQLAEQALGGGLPSGRQPIVVDTSGGHPGAAETADLIVHGEAASAVLTAITTVQLPQALLPEPTASLADLTLRVTRQDGSTYQAATRQGFRTAQRRAQLGTPGTVLPVRINPADPSRVVLDVPTFDATHPQP